MEGRLQPSERHPLGECFEVVDRLDGLDFDDRHYLAAAILRREHDIRINGRGACTYGAVLLGTRVDSYVETAAKPGLEKADDPVVFELLPDRPDEDGAHEIATIA